MQFNIWLQKFKLRNVCMRSSKENVFSDYLKLHIDCEDLSLFNVSKNIKSFSVMFGCICKILEWHLAQNL